MDENAVVKYFVIDDNAVARAMLSRVFGDDDAYVSVGEAESGSEGIIMMDEALPDVVFLKDGIGGAVTRDVIRDVRLISPNTRVIVMYDQGRAVGGLNDGEPYSADDFLQKPLSRAAVLRAVKDVMHG